LKGKITEKYDSQKAFAVEMGICQSFLSEVLSGKKYFSQKQVSEAAKLLDIKDKDIIQFFFMPKKFTKCELHIQQ
jgi:succinate dehydrogenase flavin-adding protein (antitoxin of CptAB toxin-antitoxin module)